MASLKSLTINDNGFFKLPTGTDAQRPGSPTEGGIRYNTTHGGKEIYRGNRWKSRSPRGITRSLLSRSTSGSGLILHLDAEDTDSYPGTGTTWYDLSGNDNDFRIVASAWRKSYMDFRGNHGVGKALDQLDVSFPKASTFVVITRPLNSTTTWRTMTRAWAGDHQPIIQNGQWNVGMYDNNGSAFLDAGFDQNLTPGYDDQKFELWIIRWQDSGTNTVNYNINGQNMGQIDNANADMDYGIGVLGGYSSNRDNASSGGQYWGDFRLFQGYGYRFSDAEVQDTYLALKGRLG